MEVADGGRLKVCGRGNSLLVVDMTTGRETTVTDPENNREAYLSGLAAPDGTRLALQVSKPKESRNVLYLMRVGQESPRSMGEIGSVLAWSPDSRHVLVTTRPAQPGQSQLELVSAADGSRRLLGGKLQVAAPEGAVFSPDGAYIVYATTYWGAPSDLRIHTVATGEDVPLVTKQGDARVVGWHKDGWLFYTATPTGVRDLFGVKMQGAAAIGAPEILQRYVDARVARLGPDGKIYYMLSSNVSNTYRATLNSTGTGFAAEPAIASRRAENVSRFGRYSRDRKWLAYDTGWRGTPKLVALNLESGEERERLSPFARINSLEWYPDGSALLVHGQLTKEGPFGLHRFDLLTSEVKTVLVAKGLGADLATNPTFSADGRSVLLKYWDVPEGYKPEDGTRAHVARLDLASGRVSEVFRPQRPTILRLFALSPDGERIVYGFRNGGVDGYAVVSLAGGEPREILQCKPGEVARGYSGLAFTGDGKGVVVHRVTRRDPSPDAPTNDADELWHVPLDGGESARLINTMGWTLTIMGRPQSREIA